jgi:hypothetical protein
VALLSDLAAMVPAGPLADEEAPVPEVSAVSPDLVAFVTALRDLGVPPRSVGDLSAAVVAPPRPRTRRARRED